jgi:hypothetical protein
MSIMSNREAHAPPGSFFGTLWSHSRIVLTLPTHLNTTSHRNLGNAHAGTSGKISASLQNRVMVKERNGKADLGPHT